MTAARKILSIADETDVFVPLSVRAAVRADEQGDASRQGDPLVLLQERAATWPRLSGRLRFVAASGSVI